MITKELAENYNKVFNKYPPLCYTEKFIYGVWMIGNNYSENTTKYYGKYPRGFLKRIMSMFPTIEEHNILHLFSGSVKSGGVTFDIQGEPDVQGDAHKLSEYFQDKKFDLIIADPPYTREDASKYGTPMVNRRKVLHECYKVLSDDSFVVWLDTMFPQYTNKELTLIGTIGLLRSTNNRSRMVYIWKKTKLE